jgi:hypothetical protein
MSVFLHGFLNGHRRKSQRYPSQFRFSIELSRRVMPTSLFAPDFQAVLDTATAAHAKCAEKGFNISVERTALRTRGCQ